MHADPNQISLHIEWQVYLEVNDCNFADTCRPTAKQLLRFLESLTQGNTNDLVLEPEVALDSISLMQCGTTKLPGTTATLIGLDPDVAHEKGARTATMLKTIFERCDITLKHSTRSRGKMIGA
jgi:hypothetical protein